MKTINLAPFLGLNNRLHDTELFVKDKGFFLSVAENIDINNAGKIKRREAEELVQAMTDAHSMFENYIVRDSVLYTFTLAPYVETFAKALTSNARMSWVREGDDIFYSNGTDTGRITAGTFFPLGLATPVAPSVGAIAGTLMAGTYQVAVSQYNNVTGEEGGVSPSSNPVLSLDGGLSVTLPAVASGATHINVYLSTVNGSVPFLVGNYTGATAVISAPPTTTYREAPERFEGKLPAGRLFMSGQKLCSIVGKLVYVGLPYRFGYYDIVAGYLEFPENVTVAIENQGGTYIATTEKTHWFPGNLADTQDIVRDPLPFGGVTGTEFRHPSTTSCGWFSDDGFVLADIQGQVAAVTSDVLDQEAPAEGVSNVRDTDGYLRVYSCGYCLNLENNAVTQYLDYGFTSFSGDYGTKPTGVFMLTGGAELPWLAGLGKQDFGAEQKKRMPAIYVGLASVNPVSARIQTDSGDDYSYEARDSDESMQIQRIDPGKGLESNWFEIDLFGTGSVEMSSVSFATPASSRRI